MMAVTVESLHGRVLDVDSNEFIPVGRWVDLYGKRVEKLVETSALVVAAAGGFDESASDSGEITPESVWVTKGSAAPGSSDLDRRPAVLDMMGISRQLVYPSMGLIALIEALGGLGFTPSTEESRATAWAALDAVNEWAAERTNKCPDRLRYVGILASAKPGATPEWMATETERLIAAGLKAVLIPTGVPPSGLLPSDAALDPFYATLADAGVPLLAHPPCGMGYVSDAWMRLDPLVIGSSHAPIENFVRSMTLGGVFERHPTLRFGAIKTGAWWIGALADYMDFAVDESRTVGQFHSGGSLSLRPSEYLARNVRVTPFNFEPVDTYFERYPQLSELYCYSTHYPDPTGGEWSLRRFHEIVVPVGDEAVEKFFCTNAELLLP